MPNIFSSCLSCIIVIGLGFLLKTLGIILAEDRRPLNRIITHITLPCAIINGVSSMELTANTILMVLLGLISALLMILLTNVLTRKLSKEGRQFFLMSCGAFNVSSFTIPFLQSLVPASRLIYAFAFDAGNALMATNGAYITTCALTGRQRDGTSFLQRLISSIPFDVYLVMLALSLLHIPVPNIVVQLVRLPAAANPFIAMFVIGVMLEFRVDKSSIKKTFGIVAIRLGFAAFMCLVVSWIPFLDAEQKKIVCICLFSPVSSMAPIFIDLMGGDTSLSSFTFTCSTIASIFVMTCAFL